MFRSEECRLRMFLYLSPQMSLENSVNTAEYGRMKFCGGQVCYWSKLLWRIKIHYIFSTVVSDSSILFTQGKNVYLRNIWISFQEFYEETN